MSDVNIGDVVIDIPTGYFFECISKYEDGSLMGDRFKCIYVPKSGGMVFKGVVDALPEVASDGDVYKVSSTEWELHSDSVPVDCAYGAIVTDNGIFLDRPGDSGTFEFADEIALAAEKVGKIPAPIKIVSAVDNLEFVINYESQETDFYPPDGGPPTMSCSIHGSTNVSHANISVNAPVEMYYAKMVGNTYIYHNGEWVEL